MTIPNIYVIIILLYEIGLLGSFLLFNQVGGIIKDITLQQIFAIIILSLFGPITLIASLFLFLNNIDWSFTKVPVKELFKKRKKETKK